MRPFAIAALLATWVVLAMGATWAVAQVGGVAFSGMAIDPAAPVEVSADELSVSQADGTAVFNGNVEIAQGALKLTAGRVQIEYDAENSRAISRLVAEGG